MAIELNDMHDGYRDGDGDGNGESKNENESTATNLDLLELSKSGYGADIVMASLGGNYFRASFDSLNDGGALITCGSSTVHMHPPVVVV